jgi:hypothetical protein
MAIRKLFRIVLWAMFAMLAGLLGFIFLVVRQSRLEQQAYNSEGTAGLSAVPPHEVTFDLRSMWKSEGLLLPLQKT